MIISKDQEKTKVLLPILFTLISKLNPTERLTDFTHTNMINKPNRKKNNMNLCLRIIGTFYQFTRMITNNTI